MPEDARINELRRRLAQDYLPDFAAYYELGEVAIDLDAKVLHPDVAAAFL